MDRMRDSVFSRYQRPTEPDEDAENENKMIDRELKDYIVLKKKKNINLLIHVLEKMLVIEKSSDETFQQTLAKQIEMLDPEKRVFDPRVKQ